MDNSKEVEKCSCAVAPAAANKPLSKTKLTVQSVPSTLLSILIAFFPKCPLCWAVYMSMFGCVGITNLPYMRWLLPVLLVFLGIHLFMLYKKASRIGYVPFVISLFGAVTILFSRAFFPFEKWLLILGMTSIIAGSLLNNFSGTRLKLNLNTFNHN
ncbi:MAG: hypothetical protein JWP44_628 [Mucilaginibacter sp.]|nr:hypothetical protein [Mucilaginibacter sp.]